MRLIQRREQIYLLIPQISICKSVCLYICHSICLYLAYIANLSHDRLWARPVCCTGPDNVQVSRVRLFRCEQVIHFNEFMRCAFANIYISPSATCMVRIGRQVAHMVPWRTIYNYKQANLCVRLRGRPSFCTQISAHTPTDHTLDGYMH